MKYDILIENLENIINNWYDRGSLKEVIKSPPSCAYATMV